MMGKYSTRVQCGHDGCDEYAHFSSETRKEQAGHYQRYARGQWLCVRHSQPEEVLGPGNAKRVHEMRVFDAPHGLYWGSDGPASGFVFGPGFKAYAKDFPPGTMIRITAEIVEASLPSSPLKDETEVSTSITKTSISRIST